MSNFNNNTIMEKYPYKTIHKVQIMKTEKFSIFEKVEYKLYEVNMNFDEAHDKWTNNKIKGKNGTYKYKTII